MSDRPGSAAQSVQSHQTSSTGTGARGGAPPPVAMNEISGADPYDRYKLMFTGPDGMRDHNVRRMNDEFTGTGERSFERTGNLSYMFRTAKDVPFPKGKHGRLGEIGGEIEIWNIKKGL